MLKKAISLISLVMYLHGMSGYTMSFHKCMITGFENVYTGYGLEDPCGEEDRDCNETSIHFEAADCCDLEQTIVSVDDDRDITYQKLQVDLPVVVYVLFASYKQDDPSQNHPSYFTHYFIEPPGLSAICVFRI